MLCLVALRQLLRVRTSATWKRGVWAWVLALLVLASALGAAAHGLEWSGEVRDAIWKPLYLMLAVSVALFLVGSLHDWRGEAAARRFLPWAMASGALVFVPIEWLGGAFVIFVVYETATMLAALAMYASLAATRRTAGAGLVAIGLALTIAAGAVQVSSLAVRVIVPFDHNGLFHLVQLIATAVLVIGLRRGLDDRPEALKVRPPPLDREPSKPERAGRR